MKTEQLSASSRSKTARPVRILQFGEGNFLRAFADSFIQTLNDEGSFDGNIVIIKPTNRGGLEKFMQQDCLYTAVTRGISDGETVESVQLVDSIEETVNPYTDYERFLSYAHSEDLKLILSNTTEAGIVFSESDRFETRPATTFPGKLTQFLYERFCWFHGDLSKGLVLLPVELIDDNGAALKDCVLRFAQAWKLPADFIRWLETSCTFINTLVDRIVSGFPRENAEEFFDTLGYADQLLTVAEPFGLWVIEADEALRQEILPGSASLPILFVKDYRPYKERKVRILNGAHTSFAMLAYLCGLDYVREAMDDPQIHAYIEELLFREVIPCLTLPEDELVCFANAVLERFENPFVKHALLSISLNSISKWRTRCLPSLLAYVEKNNTLPPCLTFSLASLLQFYKGTFRECDGKSYTVKDDDDVLAFFRAHQQSENAVLVSDYLSQTDFHGEDLRRITGLEAAVTAHLDRMDCEGVKGALTALLRETDTGSKEAYHE